MTGEPFYRSDLWRRLRLEVLRRQPVCTTPGCGARAVAVDHIIQRARGGPDTLANLRGLCTTCHNMRRRGGEPRAKGCDAAGNPRDPGAWWNVSQKHENLSGLGGKDRSGGPLRVSSVMLLKRRI